MSARPTPIETKPRPDPQLQRDREVAFCAPTLVTARIWPRAHPLACVTVVGELDAATIGRLRDQALALRARHREPLLLELRYVESPRAAALVAPLRDLEAHDIRIIAASVAPRPPRSSGRQQPPPPAREGPRSASAGGTVGAVDPFGLDPSFRALCLPPLRLLFERYFRVEVSGVEHVPSIGPALLAANHSGAIPLDAAMLAVALHLRHPERRGLRVLYERWVDNLPWLSRVYARLGAVPASFANAELLLRRGELVGLFPEGLAGGEKTWRERYHLRPFRTGVARLSLCSGTPIVPVAIVGAEETYPLLARSRLAGRVIGLPWVPVTPFFPLLGLAGALPLPSRWHIRFCPPIHPSVVTQGSAQHSLAREITHQLRRTVDVALGEILARRRGIFR